MEILLWLVVLIPFAGAAILILFGALLPKRVVGAVGSGSIAVSWILAMLVTVMFLARGSVSSTATLYPWIAVDGLRVGMGLRLDALSLVMMDIVTFVAFMIHLYSVEYMYEDDSYSRFFGYMNLFVGSMLILVMAGNLLLLYLGWEGVGLCSYLLIGFWYKVPFNNYAAQKAFIITRIGDTALAIGLFALFVKFGTLDIQAILAQIPGAFPSAGTTLAIIAFLLLAGAIAKSAQIPLQTWLPDAMVGPTPVSALIHAATMVTAGVYLIARMHTLFSASPAAHYATAVIGTLTLLYAGLSALVQRDIKRVLAYSTISQVGYMFLALGVGAWTAAIFHFVTHALFKSLLFLSAGAVIESLGDERDLFKMGGLRRVLPVTFWTFLIGAASLAALPFVTAGFYSKDAILWAGWASALGSTWFWLAGITGALITGGYAFRMVFLVFFGEQHSPVVKTQGVLIKLPMIVLATLSIIIGFIQMPRILGGFDPFGRLMSKVLPTLHLSPYRSGTAGEWALLFVSVVESLLGIYLPYLYFRHHRWSSIVEGSPAARAVHNFLFAGFGFDWLYDRVFVRPFKEIAFANRSDIIDKFYDGLAWTSRMAHTGLSSTVTGRVRDYAVGLAIGAIVVVLIVLIR